MTQDQITELRAIVIESTLRGELAKAEAARDALEQDRRVAQARFARLVKPVSANSANE